MTTARKKIHSDPYSKFNQINGKHPLMKNCPDSFISYKARKRKGGKVSFFNFDLAKEMGIIPKDHPLEITKELETKILDTFSIVIINEYDQINEIKYPEEDILPNEFMATRYLQLQHPNKQGKTSGDGRSIWNGSISNKGKTWDISSCGTGATRLSPATHIQKRYFQTGDPSISYGCGYSEVDEGLGTLFFSEVLNRNGYQTERVLGIIEFSKGISINIRAHVNLIRPSHMFNHLKQSNYDALSNIVNYFIDREVGNKRWTNVPTSHKGRLKYFLDKQVETFAKLSANFEDDYIFCWLDWDGDNILMDGGIIDYGSVRQFGLFHHEYRYDDVQRYSTTIKEQKDKAKYIVKCFIQIYDYLTTKEKKPINAYNKHEKLEEFEVIFQRQKSNNLLQKIGYTQDICDYLITKKSDTVEKLKNVFSYFERSKSVLGPEEVSDGINWNAIFCMRDILRELPQIYLHRDDVVSREEFMEIMKSSYATEEDIEINPTRAKKIDDFQALYLELIDYVSKKNHVSQLDTLLAVTMRSSIINKYDRVTGDSITTIVNKVLAHRPKLNSEQMFELMHEFAEYQNLDPDTKRLSRERNTEHSKIMRGMLKIVRTYREGI
ncbi:hypothetical protein [Bacteriovorax sp. Seq25_V]|uniref:hypothetical protein n=1 Tax=Bacteriovorax sp. Seq25_V TaxID=1201288 RepID=UPI000554F480|nr:hypothetical protein [Bacteriovorax sp. Seq25_V]